MTLANIKLQCKSLINIHYQCDIIKIMRKCVAALRRASLELASNRTPRRSRAGASDRPGGTPPQPEKTGSQPRDSGAVPVPNYFSSTLLTFICIQCYTVD